MRSQWEDGWADSVEGRRPQARLPPEILGESDPGRPPELSVFVAGQSTSWNTIVFCSAHLIFRAVI